MTLKKTEKRTVSVKIFHAALGTLFEYNTQGS